MALLWSAACSARQRRTEAAERSGRRGLMKRSTWLCSMALLVASPLGLGGAELSDRVSRELNDRNRGPALSHVHPARIDDDLRQPTAIDIRQRSHRGVPGSFIGHVRNHATVFDDGKPIESKVVRRLAVFVKSTLIACTSQLRNEQVSRTAVSTDSRWAAFSDTGSHLRACALC